MPRAAGSKILQIRDYFRDTDLDEAKAAFNMVSEVMHQRIARVERAKESQVAAVTNRKPAGRKPGPKPRTPESVVAGNTNMFATVPGDDPGTLG
jgi:hypothetical protein